MDKIKIPDEFLEKAVIMDDLKITNPELFNESGGMDWKLFEKEYRPKYSIFIRKDVKSISFTFSEKFNANDAIDFLKTM